MKIFQQLKLVFITLLFTIGLAACEESGPVESAGKNIDQAIETTGEKINETVDKVSESMSEDKK